MTTLGKTLTLINVALSLIFVAFASGLYANQIFWHTPQSQDGQTVKGLVDQLRDKAKDQQTIRDNAEKRWYDATAELLVAENERPKLLDGYADRMAKLRKGEVKDGKSPVQPLQFTGSDLKWAREQAGLELDGKPLSKAGYEKTIQAKIKELADAKEELSKLVAETQQLTVEINGTKEKEDALTDAEKGRRVKWEDYKKLVKEYDLERNFLVSPITTISLEIATLKQRQKSLKDTLDALNAGSALGRK